MGAMLRGVLRFRLLILVAAAGVMFFGISVLRAAPVDVLPEFSPPHAEVQTEALGLSADEVEQLITVPLEADLLNGVEGVRVIRSESLPGLSSIVLVFAPGTDIYQARQLIEERLAQAHALPNVSKPPTLLQPLSTSNRFLMIGLSSDRLSHIEQSVIARWTIRPRLLGVPGVANVSVWGMRDQQLQVQVDPVRLRQQGVTLAQVIESAGNAQVVSPLSFLEASTPGTGGFLESPQQRLQVRHLIERIADPQELAKVPVSGTNGKLRLGDVSTIVVDHQPLIGDAVVDGGAGLMLVVEKFPGTSTLEVTEGVEDALETLRPGLSGLRTDTSLFRPASYIEEAGGNVAVVLVVGFLLMLLVLAGLRTSWRGLGVIAVTLPLSIITAALLLHLLGQGINALVVLGLAAGLSVMVDEGIVLSHRAIRSLRGPAAGRLPVSTAVTVAAHASRGPLTYATIASLLVALPVVVVSGRPGDFLEPMVRAYVLAVAAAVLVALVVTPVLTAVLYSRWRPGEGAGTAPRRLTAGYESLLGRLDRRQRIPWLVAGSCLLLGVAAIPALDTAVVPDFRDRSVVVRLDAEPGTSNTRMTELARGLVTQLRDVDGVANAGAHIGRAVTGDRVTNVDSADVWVSIANGADYKPTVEAIRRAAADVPGTRNQVLTYSADRIRDVGALVDGDNRVAGNGFDVLTGSEAPLVVRVFGENPEVLQREAERVRRLMGRVDGVVAPRVVPLLVQPTLDIEVDLDRARERGLTPGAVRRAAAALLQGIQVGSVFQEQKVFDVIVQGAPSTRTDVEAVRDLLIDAAGGKRVRLGDVADVRITDAPAVIQRDAVSRRIDIEAGIEGRDAGAVAADIERRLQRGGFPLEYHAEVFRAGAGDEAGAGRVAGFAVAVLVAIFLLLQAAFRSWSAAGLVVGLLPLTLAGGLAAAMLGGEFSLGSAVGLVAVLALALRSSLLLVADARAATTSADGQREAVRQAAQEQFASTLSSLAAFGALVLPMAVLGSRPGLELLNPFAVAVAGGLVTTAVVTLVVLPALLPMVTLAPAAAAPEQRLPTTIDLDAREVVTVGADGMPYQRAADVAAGTDGAAR